MKADRHFTVREIAEWVSGTVEGDPSASITGPADLESAEPHHISFCGNERYLKRASESRAGAILVRHDFQLETQATQIRVDNPSDAFALIITRFIPEPPRPEPGVHPSASVDPSASVNPLAHIGPHVVIGPDASIGPGSVLLAGSLVGCAVRIGTDCTLHPGAIVLDRCELANRVIIHSGAVIGSDGFGYEFRDGRHQKIPQVGIVRIDNDVEIGANTTIDRGRFDKTWIREGTKIDNLVMVAHNVTIGPHAIIVAQNGISGSSRLGAYVIMGGQSATVGHITVGDQVTLTAWTAVTKDITQPGVYRGGPAKPMRESMKIEALTHRLPELYERLKALESQVGK